MSLNKEYVTEIFSNLETDSNKFFENVCDDVHWIVEGTHT